MFPGGGGFAPGPEGRDVLKSIKEIPVPAKAGAGIFVCREFTEKELRIVKKFTGKGLRNGE